MTTQRAARSALKKILSSLSGFAVDCGLSLNEVNSILREGAVKSAVVRQSIGAGRINISGVAAMTGISRSEISRILKWTGKDTNQAIDRRESLTNRILRAWRQDPRFTTANGRPKVLNIYGRGPTFESLAKAYGRGIPIRALFDELTRIGAIEVRASKRIFPAKSSAIKRRTEIKNISAMGDAVSDLVSSALMETRYPHGSGIATGSQRIWTGAMPLSKEDALTHTREIFIDLHNVLLRHKTISNVSRKSPKTARLLLTAVLSEVSRRPLKRSRQARRNLRRNA